MERELAVALRSCVGQVDQRTRRQVVDHVDVTTLGEQTVDQRGADEARAAGDEDPHRSVPRIVRLGRGEVGATDACARRTRTDDRTAPTHEPARHDRAGPDVAPAPITESATSAPAPIDAPSCTTDRNTRASASTDVAARGPSRRPWLRRRRALRHPTPPVRRDGGRIDVDIALHPHARRRSPRPARWRPERAGEQVGMHPEILLGRADVDPVGVALQRVQAARLLEHARERLPLDRHGETRGDAGQHRRLQHVGARVDPMRGRLARRRLLHERHDLAVAASGHHTERRRIVDLGERRSWPRRRARRGSAPTHRGRGR